jgi:HAMP domain-containing protein
MGWLIWVLVGREVKVLARTAQAVARRTPESLDPIDSKAVPDEVQPLVGALNGLMARLGEALGQQRQFIADADRAAFGRDAAALPPSLPPLWAGDGFLGLPYPEPPGFSPPRSILFTVAHARRSASSFGTPRCS